MFLGLYVVESGTKFDTFDIVLLVIVSGVEESVVLVESLEFLVLICSSSTTGMTLDSDTNKLCEKVFHSNSIKLRDGLQSVIFLEIVNRPLCSKQMTQFLKLRTSMRSLPILAATVQQPYRLEDLPSRGGYTPLVCLLTILFCAQQNVQLVSALLFDTNEATSTHTITNKASFTIQFFNAFLKDRICSLRLKYFSALKIIDLVFSCLFEFYYLLSI